MQLNLSLGLKIGTALLDADSVRKIEPSFESTIPNSRKTLVQFLEKFIVTDQIKVLNPGLVTEVKGEN